MLIICGPSCSGKSTFGRLAAEMGLVVIEGSILVKELFLNNGLPGEDVIDFCRRWYRERGSEVFARENHIRMVANMVDFNRTVFIGCRASGEVHYLKRLASKSRAIGLYSDTSIRFHRGLIRNRPDQPKTLVEFIRRDMREFEMGLAEVLSYAVERLVVAESSLSTFELLAKSEIQDYCKYADPASG